MLARRHHLTGITAVLLASALPAQIVDWGVSRGPIWEQQADNMAPAVPESWDFEFFIDALTVGDITSAVVKGPGLPAAGASLVPLNAPQTAWSYIESFADEVAMDARFPAGATYTLETTGSLGALVQPLALPVRNTPVQPVFTGTSLSQLRQFDEQSPQLITWNSPGTAQIVSLVLLDPNSLNPVVQFDSFLGATQHTINGNTLSANECYFGGLAYLNFTKPAGPVFGAPGSIVDVQVSEVEASTWTRFGSVQNVRNPAGVNPSALLPDPNGAVIGGLWRPRVDHTNFAQAAVVDILVIAGAPAQTPSPFGVFLVNPAAQLAPFFFTAPGVPWTLPIPNNCAFYGLTVPTQAAALYPNGFFQVTNALDVTLGAF